VFSKEQVQYGPKFDAQGVVPTNIPLVAKLEWFTFLWCKNFGRIFFIFSHFTCLSDKQTDRQTALRSPIIALHSMQCGKQVKLCPTYLCATTSCLERYILTLIATHKAS